MLDEGCENELFFLLVYSFFTYFCYWWEGVECRNKVNFEKVYILGIVLRFKEFEREDIVRSCVVLYLDYKILNS